MNLTKIKHNRINLNWLVLISCIVLSAIYFNFISDICKDEPAIKCIIFYLAAGLVFFCKIAICMHLSLLLAHILCKKIPTGFALPSSKEIKFVGIIFITLIGLFFVLSTYYEEAFYTEGLYLAGKYLIVAISIMLHNKFKKEVVV